MRLPDAVKDSEKDGISPVPRRRVGEGLAKEELGGSLEGVGLPRRSLKGGAGAEVSVGVDGEVSCESACAARNVCVRGYLWQPVEKNLKEPALGIERLT